MKTVEEIVAMLDIMLSKEDEDNRRFKYELISNKQQAEDAVRCEHYAFSELRKWITQEQPDAEKRE